MDDNILLEIGKRYKVPHGIGILVGYEQFTEDGMGATVVQTKPEGRWHRDGFYRNVFRLQPGHTWLMGHDNYCATNHEVQELE